jgi:hypothetical protein
VPFQANGIYIWIPFHRSIFFSVGICSTAFLFFSLSKNSATVKNSSRVLFSGFQELSFLSAPGSAFLH